MVNTYNRQICLTIYPAIEKEKNKMCMSLVKRIKDLVYSPIHIDLHLTETNQIWLKGVKG